MSKMKKPSKKTIKLFFKALAKLQKLDLSNVVSLDNAKIDFDPGLTKEEKEALVDVIAYDLVKRQKP
jgi:hypothetical protein